MTWQQFPIKSFGRIVTGKTPPTTRVELFGRAFPFITPTDIDGVQRKVVTGRFLSENGREFQSSLLLPAKTVCVVCIGATIGKICLTDRPSFTNQQINSVIVNEAEHDPHFVYYALKLKSSDLIKLAGGAATPILNKSNFSEVEIPAPPLKIQQKIGRLLSVYDDLIENNTRRIQILEEIARRVYEEWFVQFRFPGYENIRMIENELGILPDGWDAKRLGDIAHEMRRAIDPSEVEPSTPYVGLEHIPRRSIALMDWGEAKDVQSTKHIFKAGNILFGKIRPYFHKVSVAPVDGVCSSDAIVIEAKKHELFPFVLGTVSSDAFVQYATQTSNGVNMPRANWGELLKYPVYIPTNDLRKKYSDYIESGLVQIQSLTFKIRALRQVCALLLPKLMSGEMDVCAFPAPVSD